MFKIGDTLTKENYTKGAVWCNENGLRINPKTWQIEEIPQPTAEEFKKIEITELKRKLADSDYAIIKIAEGAATTDEYAELITQREQWRNRINELEQ